jgi:hypothetical protein
MAKDGSNPDRLIEMAAMIVDIIDIPFKILDAVLQMLEWQAKMSAKVVN